MNPTWLFVAAAYALAVWLLRRAGLLELRWRWAALFYILVLVFLWRPMTQQYVNVPVDFLQTLPPWAHLTRNHAQGNWELNDLTLQIVPWAHQVRESWKSFDLPLWNERSGGGYPLLGNGQSSALSLLRFLALPLPLGYAMTAEAAMKLLIALTAMFLFGRRRGWSDTASAVGAIAYGFCTFLITWLHFPIVTVSCLLPAVFLLIDMMVERITYKRFVAAAVVWAVMLFGGHPESVSHIFFLALLYMIWILAVERPLTLKQATRFVLISGGALTVAAMLAAPFLMPLFETIKRSKRYHELKVMPNVIGYYSDFPSQIVLLQPHFYGQVPWEHAWGPARAESVTGFAGVLGVGAWFTLLIYCIATRRWRSRELFFVIATLIVLGAMLGWPVISEIFHFVFRLAANARLRLLLCFLVAAMAAAAVDLIERDKARRAYLAGLALVGAMLWYVMQYDFPDAYDRDTAMIAMLPSLITILCAAVVPFIPIRARSLAVAVVATMTLNELWRVGRNWNPTVSTRYMYPKTPLIEKLQALHREQPKSDPIRIVGLGPFFFPNAAAMYGFEDIRAHDPMSNGRYLGILRVLSRYDTEDYFAKWVDIESGMLDYLNVKYVLAPPKAELETWRYRMVYDDRDGRIFENTTVLPRFFVTPIVVLEFRRDVYAQRLMEQKSFSMTSVLNRLPVENDKMRNDLLAPREIGRNEAKLRMISAKPTEFVMRVDAPRYTMISSSQPFWPGWKVEHNGKAIEPLEVNGAFLGFTVPPGTTEVRVYYDPVSFKGGAALSLLTVLGLALPSARSRIRRRKAAAAQE